MKKATKKLIWVWHCHHDVLLEPLTEPLKNRIKFIKENKPKDEIKLRLKLLKPVRGKLPEEFIEACQKYVEARQKYDEVEQKYNEEYDEARQKYDEMWQEYGLQIEALHKKECPDCSWNSKRQTIFPKKK